jgi:predicted nuclease of predicted toxin-antitoxin system
MHFKIDENLPPEVAELLRQEGHEVATIFDQGLRSHTDPEVIAACQVEGRVLLSLDLDFSNLLLFPPEQFAGLIVLRLHRPGRTAVLQLVRRLLPHLSVQPVVGKLWVVDETRIRIRQVGEVPLGDEPGTAPR